jgi:hypothetical protein
MFRNMAGHIEAERDRLPRSFYAETARDAVATPPLRRRRPGSRRADRAIWSMIAALKLVSPVFLPTPARVWLALENGFAHTDLPAKALGTIRHMFGGRLAASIAGAALGALIGSCKAARKGRLSISGSRWIDREPIRACNENHSDCCAIATSKSKAGLSPIWTPLAGLECYTSAESQFFAFVRGRRAGSRVFMFPWRSARACEEFGPGSHRFL